MTRQYRDRTKHQNGASITNSSVSLTAGTLLQGQGLSGATFPYTVAVYAQDTSGNLTSYEEMDVTGGTFPTLTVTRGVNGTTAVAHDTTHIIAQVVGKNDLDNFLQAGNSIDIGSDSATIAKVNLTDQGSAPAAPASGHHIIYSKSGGIYAETSAAVETQLATNPLTTQDDIVVAGASGVPGRLAKGSDGQVLTVDPTTHHLLWATPSGGGGTSAAELGYVQVTASQTPATSSTVDVTSMSLTVTVGTRAIMLDFYCPLADFASASDRFNFLLVDVTGSATVGSAWSTSVSGGNGQVVNARQRVAPSAGSRTYKVQVVTPGSSGPRLFASSTAPMWFRIYEV